MQAAADTDLLHRVDARSDDFIFHALSICSYACLARKAMPITGFINNGRPDFTAAQETTPETKARCAHRSIANTRPYTSRARGRHEHTFRLDCDGPVRVQQKHSRDT